MLRGTPHFALTDAHWTKNQSILLCIDLQESPETLEFCFGEQNFYWTVFKEVGVAAFVGMSVFMLCVPSQFFLGRLVHRYTRFTAIRTDERLRLVNEILNGIQVIKMYVWEKPFTYLVEKARRKELYTIRKFAFIDGIIFNLDRYLPRCSLFITILTYVLLGNHINAKKVYMVTAFYNALRTTMALAFSMSISHMTQAMVSVKRVEKFLLYEEVENPVISDSTVDQAPVIETNAILLKEATAKWSPESKENTFDRLDLSVKSGSLVAVIGQVGSGKSSLLQVILRELSLTEGSLKTVGKMSYASQQPWIFASTIRQNILFGQPYDEERYRRVIEVCQMKSDLNLFPYGDNTMVGTRGINLSGGQRARISLARAVYLDADIYLLDDPLSAVDPRVGRRIMEDCICSYLKDKTRVLVTHQTHFLKHVDRIVVMNNCEIETIGTFEDLQSSDTDLLKFLKSENEADEKSSVLREIGNGEHFPTGLVDKDEKSVDPDATNEVVESRAVGGMNVKVYASYFKATRSVCLLLLLFFIFLSDIMVTSGSDYFLAYWVNTEESSLTSANDDSSDLVWTNPVPREYFIYIYSFLVGCTILSTNLGIYTFFTITMRISKTLHSLLYNSVIRTSMRFFNVNPVGRVINRFSKDMNTVDMRLPFSLIDVLYSTLNLIGVIVIMSVVNTWLLIPAFITGCIFYTMRLYYLKTTRSVKRLEGMTRSPVFNHLTATLQGLTTIRVFQAAKILTMEFDRHMDLHSSAWFLFFSASRAFGMYLELICALFNTVVLSSFLLIDDLSVVGDVGLILTQILVAAGALQWGMRQTAEMENHMTSVERVLEYGNLEEEPSLDCKANVKIPENWPTNGHVVFRNVNLKYEAGDHCVLNNINFVAQPNEKIGIVGRTGAGKSSLINALFRLAVVEGEIIIDGIDTGSIGLHDFRWKISIIPQEPVLFVGSLRQNLDPFEEFSDEILWQALDQVELREVINEMPAGLNSRVSEGGANFSVGQRQLLCLGRAIVRCNKIMILDEATANVDPYTDSLIQQTVRSKFKNCTVFTIAHRLNTIMDSDKVLVMEAGKLIEFDHPSILLKNKGHFYRMVEQTGPAMAAALHEMANSNYKQKSQ
ncbi:probable multidrug resistance-associated protein lethal(2)03659 isoform X2 [Prorops nasuta]|uniref:probable multidrug resistance-associated protein lethal(2)03659 isoform X2 n=1 Tax=Prorops nasuta TaxID=863751 RepID=UPI0034CD0BD2